MTIKVKIPVWVEVQFESVPGSDVWGATAKIGDKGIAVSERWPEVYERIQEEIAKASS